MARLGAMGEANGAVLPQSTARYRHSWNAEHSNAMDAREEGREMSDTPETDCEIDLIEVIGDNPISDLIIKRKGKEVAVVDANFARRLEYERDEARKDLHILQDKMYDVLKELERIRKDIKQAIL